MLHFGEMEACEYNARYGTEWYAFENEGTPLTKKLLSEWNGQHDDSHDDFHVAMYADSKTRSYVVAPQCCESNIRVFDFAFEARAYYKMLVGILIDNDFFDYLGEPDNEDCYAKALTQCDMFFAASKEYEVEGVSK